MKEKIIIKIHSFVDLITNSSTEIFVIDRSHDVDFVRNVILEKFPELYDEFSISLSEDDTMWRFNEYDKENAIKFLKKFGYTVIAPENEEVPMSIQIYAERGTMTSEFIIYMEETFNGEYSSNG